MTISVTSLLPQGWNKGELACVDLIDVNVSTECRQSTNTSDQFFHITHRMDDDRRTAKLVSGDSQRTNEPYRDI